MPKRELDELRRMKAVLNHNTKMQDLLVEVRVLLDDLLKAEEAFADKRKAFVYKVRRLQGELTSHKTALKKQVPPKLEKAVKAL